MPAKRLPMRLVRDILRLRHGGLSQRDIARSLSIGLGTVCECLVQAGEAGGIIEIEVVGGIGGQ